MKEKLNMFQFKTFEICIKFADSCLTVYKEIELKMVKKKPRCVNF